jgi:hypothetical protein
MIASKDSKKFTQVELNSSVVIPSAQNQNISISQKNTTAVLV